MKSKLFPTNGDPGGMIAFAADVEPIDFEKHLIVLTKCKTKIGWVKINSIFTSMGKDAIDLIKKYGFKILLDLKVNDIPNTCENHARELARMGVHAFTMHAMAGIGAMERVVKYLEKEFGNERPMVFAVTVLTSIDDDILNQELGIAGNVKASVLRFADNSIRAGVDGIICSPNEVRLIMNNVNGAEDVVIGTPGIRFADDGVDDQKRIATPVAAIANGSDLLIMGRALKGETDAVDANIKRTIKEIKEGLKARSA